MHWERQRSGFSSKARAVLAGLLAVLLLGSVAFSATHALHQSLHNDGSIPGHVCLLCSLAQGHLNAAETACILAVICLCPIFILPLVDAAAPSRFDYRLSPSRAPPLR